MEVLLNVVKILIVIIFSMIAIIRLLNFITRWREKGELKKLYIVSVIVWLTVVLLFHLISRL